MGKRSVFVLGTVNAVLENYLYPCCRSANCYRRVRALDDEQNSFICNKCFQEYKKEDIAYRYRVTLVTSDATQTAEVTLFGSCLDHFFGCSATEFNSIVCCIESECESYGIPISRVVHQAMEQCFIGRFLKFGFKVDRPFRKTSRDESSSPVKLADITARGCRSHINPNIPPQLTACQVLKAVPKEPLVTVLDILTETVRQIWGESPNGNPSSLENYQKEYKTNSQIDAVLSNSQCSFLELQPTCTAPMSSQYCTPRSLSEFMCPMVLTCDSNSSAEAIQSRLFTSESIDQFPETPVGKKSTSLNAAIDEYQETAESTNPFASFKNGENQKSSNLESLLDVAESTCADTDVEQVCEFPSSLDLSTFLADLVLDELGQPLNDEEQNTNENIAVSGKENKRSCSENRVRVSLGKSERELEDQSVKEDSWMPCFASLWQSKRYSTEDITDALELPRCASNSANETGQSVFLKNSPLSLCSVHDAEKPLLNHSAPSSNMDWNEVSDFPSSEDLDAFLANIESSYFGNGVSRSSFLSTSIDFIKLKDSSRKHSVSNKKFILDSSHEDLETAVGINMDAHLTDLDDCLPFCQFTGQRKSVSSGNKAICNSDKRPFEINETFLLDDPHSVSDEKAQRRCNENTTCYLGKESTNDGQCFIRESFEATSEDLRENSKDKYEWKSADSSNLSLTYTDTPQLFSQSFSPSLCEGTPLLFSDDSLEEISGLLFAEDMEDEVSHPPFSRSHPPNEPCSPVYAKLLQTRSSEEMLWNVRDHSTPLYTNCHKFGSTRVSRVLFSSAVKENTCLATPITCRSGYCSSGKLSCPISFTYFTTPLLFS